jgi:ABC-type phosphate transport system substrate-binding protein
MQTRLIVVRVGAWVAIALAGMASFTPAVAQTNAVVMVVAVVVSDRNPVTNLSTGELRKLFSGEKHAWAGGLPVKLFVRAPGAYERVVLLKLLDMSESEYKKYWTAQVFRGDAQAEPVALFSNGMQKEALAAFPGAVALVNFQDVKPGMKVIRVDGHLPGDAAYPLN